MLTRIFNFLNDGWEKLRTLLVTIGELLKRATGSTVAYFATAAASAKFAYDRIAGQINGFIEELQKFTSTSTPEGLTAIEYIGFANYIFPVQELIQVIVLIFQWWIMCLVYRMYEHFSSRAAVGAMMKG